ncbi:MAG: alpha/beta hydrolase [Minwuia sp.]|uniref:alpha/beta hydrolase n=1 Tax=Minwuia sp. TaxID=2493630 RepID=UPI003A8C4D2C
MRMVLYTLIAFAAALAALFLLGPRERIDATIRFDPATLGADPEAVLAQSEARFSDIREGLQKEIVWRDPATKRVTDWAVVYVHGFSASKTEIRPLPDLVAEALDANVFYTRLTGHGRTGEAMAEAEAGDWLNDAAEAIEVGRRIGRKVLVVATSTGATASAFFAPDPALSKDIAGFVFVSPNFGVQAPGADYLTLPWMRRIVPLIFGKEREFTSGDAAHNLAWTTRYPVVAVLPMIALVKHVRDLDFTKARQPLLVLHAPDDEVVKPEATRKIHDRWGGPKHWIDVEGTGNSHHVIAGEIMEPERTGPLADEVIAWVRALP